MASDLPKPSELAELLEAASLSGARVLTPGVLFLGRQPLELHYLRVFYEGSTKHDLPPVPMTTKKANAQLIVQASALAEEVLGRRRVGEELALIAKALIPLWHKQSHPQWDLESCPTEECRRYRKALARWAELAQEVRDGP